MSDTERSLAPGTVHVRLDGPTKNRLDEYMRATGMTISQATRTLLEMALRNPLVNAEVALQRSAFKEGLLAGYGHIQKRLQQTMAEAVQEAASTSRD